MIGTLIEFDDLRKLSRLGDAAKLSTVERWAQRVGIRYQYDGRGGIWTTVDAMNAALGLNAMKPEDTATYDVEMF